MTMSLGKIHTYPGNPRVMKATIAAKYNGVDVDVNDKFMFGVDNRTQEFLQKFPFGKVPAMDTKDGPIFESNAIAYYVAASKENSHLLGKNAYESAQIIQFLTFSENEIVPLSFDWLSPIHGYSPFVEEDIKKAKEELKKALIAFDRIVENRTFLVGDRITIADICVACNLIWLYQTVMDPSYRSDIPNINRWFLTCINQPNFKSCMDQKFSLCMAEVTQPIKREQESKTAVSDKKEESKQSTQSTAATEEEEEEFVERRPRSAMDLLPKSTFNFEDWKRFYSNNETRPAAVDYFWKNYDPTGYSMWKLDYKYNEELSKVFMTCNLVGGFFQRMDHLRRYCFGNMIIFGDEGNLKVKGMFIFRGGEIPQEVKDVADFDCYEFTRIDTDNLAMRNLWNDYMAWDGQFEGEKFCEGKIFK